MFAGSGSGSSGSNNGDLINQAILFFHLAQCDTMRFSRLLQLGHGLGYKVRNLCALSPYVVVFKAQIPDGYRCDAVFDEPGFHNVKLWHVDQGILCRVCQDDETRPVSPDVFKIASKCGRRHYVPNLLVWAKYASREFFVNPAVSGDHASQIVDARYADEGCWQRHCGSPATRCVAVHDDLVDQRTASRVANEHVVVANAVLVIEEAQRGDDIPDMVRVTGVVQLLRRRRGGILGKLRVRGQAVVKAGKAADGRFGQIRPRGHTLDGWHKVVDGVSGVSPRAPVDEAAQG